MRRRYARKLGFGLVVTLVAAASTPVTAESARARAKKLERYEATHAAEAACSDVVWVNYKGRYIRSGSFGYGQGRGSYVCESAAKGAKLKPRSFWSR